MNTKFCCILESTGKQCDCEKTAAVSDSPELAGYKTNRVLSILRNPYGHSATEVKEMQLKACNLIERWRNAYENMREFADDSGLDTATHG